MGKITTKDVLNQFKADLIGKDSYRGVTLTYSWLANQFGHISLGFIPTTILFFVFKNKLDPEHAGLKAASCVALAWICFELYNFLGPLLLKKKSSSKLIYVSGSEYQFQPAWWNIAFDTFTDLCFFAFGSFLSASILVCFLEGNTSIINIILFILCIVLAYPARYWFLTKMYQQAAQFPFQYRLSQFDLAISENAKNSVQAWLDNNQTGQHLLIFGGVNSGKTSLSVGLGNEKSIKHVSVFYTTANKIISLFFSHPAEDSTITYPWHWHNCSYLVVDDIDPGDPVKEDIISANNFLQFIDTYTNSNDSNRTTIRNCSVIWVLGNDDADKNKQDDWREMLHRIGVPKNSISCIEL
ncbi:MAG: ATP-binding protein [Bacteroidota bacterium]